MSSESYGLIRQAILDKQIVTARYQGHHREMCPHALGRKKEREHALFYQIAGGSRSGMRHGSDDHWRCVAVDDLTEVAVRPAAPGEWRKATDHSKRNNCFDWLDLNVDDE